jgi:hypothetical protein
MVVEVNRNHTVDTSTVGWKGDQTGRRWEGAWGWRWPGLGFWSQGQQGWVARLGLLAHSSQCRVHFLAPQCTTDDSRPAEGSRKFAARNV